VVGEDANIMGLGWRQGRNGIMCRALETLGSADPNEQKLPFTNTTLRVSLRGIGIKSKNIVTKDLLFLWI
jgi:hypothetical protein